MPNIVYVVPTTGGVWRTKNYGIDDPLHPLHWEVLTDLLPSSSIGHMAMDPGNPQVLVAGTGMYTDYVDPVGGRVYVTTDGGDSWRPSLEDPALVRKNIRQVNVRGNRILVGTENNGLYRRIGDLNQIGEPNQPPFNLVDTIPADATIRSLVSDPSHPDRLFAAIPNNISKNGVSTNGIYRSEDDGATWKQLPTQAGGPVGNDEFRKVTQNSQIMTEKLAVGSNGRLYLSVALWIDLAWVGYSDDHGETWTSIEVPKWPWTGQNDITSIGPMTINGQSVVVVTSNTEFSEGYHAVRLSGVPISDSNGASLNGDFISKKVDNEPQKLQLAYLLTGEPVLSDGSTATTGKWQPWYASQHEGQWDKSALGVDPTESKALFIAGDREQLRWTPSDKPANNIPTAEWTSIRTRVAGDGATLHDTFPHVDSLALAFDSQGRLLLGCDGGVFRHTNPKGMGDWESLNTDLGTTQIHDVSIDPLSGMAFAGLQDNGTVTQLPDTGKGWIEIGGSDGNDVAVCGIPGAPTSDRYGQLLDVHSMDKSTGRRIGDISHPDLCVTRASADGPCLSKLNDIDGSRLNQDKIAVNKAAVALDPDPSLAKVHLVFAQSKGVWESSNEGRDVQKLHTAPIDDDRAGNVMNFAYGHLKNVDALWAISGNALLVRLTAGGPLTSVTTMPVAIQGGRDVDVVMAPDDPKHAFVVTQERVFVTTDAGATTTNWTEITGDLSHTTCGDGPQDVSVARHIYAIRYVPSTRGDRLFIGTDHGVFVAAVDNPGVWVQAGSKLPRNMAVADMDYLATGPNSSNDTLVASIYGRGAWRLPNASMLNLAPKMASFPRRDVFGLCVAAIDVPADASCKATLSPSAFGSGAIDPDRDPITFSVDSPGPYLQGEQCVMLTATDSQGAAASCKVDVRVLDLTPPVITPPGDFTSTTCGALTLAKPVVTDNCSVYAVTSNAPASFPLGTTTVTWSATDTSGNAATPVTQKVIVGGPPTFTQKPGDKSYTVCDTPPGIGTAKAVDVCGTAVTVTNNAPATFPVGTTTVTWTAVDAKGNKATFTQKVTVGAATDLQAEHFISTVKNNACLEVTKYPAWGQYVHALIIQPQATGVGWPIPFTYTNCGTNSGSGSLPGPWQQGTTRPISASCPTFIKLGANGAGSVTLTWWGNG